MIYVLGAFDGFHRGHQRLFDEAAALAHHRSCSWGVLTFMPNPKEVLGKRSFFDLFLPEEREDIARWFKVPCIETLPFTRKIAEMEPKSFLDFMDKTTPFEGLVVGENFRFGKARMGTITFLQEECFSRGKAFSSVPSAADSKGVISTTRVRHAIEGGRVEEACEMLGYPFFLQGHVVPGDQRGRALGFPTANLSVHKKKLLPEPGVYAAFVQGAKDIMPTAVNIGYNPTFEGIRSLRIEAHIKGCHQDLYGQFLRIYFLAYLRSEKKFSTSQELMAQLQQDMADLSRHVQLWHVSKKCSQFTGRPLGAACIPSP